MADDEWWESNAIDKSNGDSWKKKLFTINYYYILFIINECCWYFSIITIIESILFQIIHFFGFFRGQT